VVLPKALSTLFSSYHSYCQELMKSVGSHGSSSLLFMMKMMVWYFMSDTHDVIVVFSLQSHKLVYCPSPTNLVQLLQSDSQLQDSDVMCVVESPYLVSLLVKAVICTLIKYPWTGFLNPRQWGSTFWESKQLTLAIGWCYTSWMPSFSYCFPWFFWTVW
jgi:hypothetical protein